MTTFGILIGLFLIGMAIRMWMAICKPEHYKRLVDYESQQKERQREMLGKGIALARRFRR